MPEVRQMISRIRGAIDEKIISDLSEMIDRAAPEALERLKQLVREGPAPVSFRAAESILDRSSVSPKRQIHSKHDVQGMVMHLHIGRSELERLYSVMLEDAGGDSSLLPPMPKLEDGQDYVVVIDQTTGEILSEGV